MSRRSEIFQLQWGFTVRKKKKEGGGHRRALLGFGCLKPAVVQTEATGLVLIQRSEAYTGENSDCRQALSSHSDTVPTSQSSHTLVLSLRSVRTYGRGNDTASTPDAQDRNLESHGNFKRALHVELGTTSCASRGIL